MQTSLYFVHITDAD